MDRRLFFIDSNLSELNYNLAPEREIGDYQFIQQRLGEVNCSIPIQRTVDKNNQGIEKLNAKTILNRQELKEIHPYMERHLERNHVPAHLLNDKTREGTSSM